MIFKNLCVLVLWTNVSSVLKGLKHEWVNPFMPKVILEYAKDSDEKISKKSAGMNGLSKY